MDTACKKFKKITCGKYNRAILDEDGKLFFQGRSKTYMFGSDFDGGPCLRSFVKIDEDFYPREDKTDKFIDVALGKKHIVLVTEGGKVYGSGYVFYRRVRPEARKNEQNNEDYPFEIFLPAGWKAIACFAMVDKGLTVFINAEKNGQKKTFGFGE